MSFTKIIKDFSSPKSMVAFPLFALGNNGIESVVKSLVRQVTFTACLLLKANAE
jgi:hypothetical protein